MANKKNGKKNGDSTAVAVAESPASEYPICDPIKRDKLARIMRENRGANDGFNLLDKITMPSGKGMAFTVPGIDGDTSMQTMDVIVGMFLDHRVYYKESFADTGGNDAPDCASQDLVNGIGNPGGDCASCPQNQWDSAAKGTGKACSEKRLMMIFLPGMALPIKLDAPPTSLRKIAQYFLRLSSKEKLYRHVVTRFALEKDKSAKGVEYSKITATWVRDLSEEEIVGVEKYMSAFDNHNTKG